MYQACEPPLGLGDFVPIVSCRSVFLSLGLGKYGLALIAEAGIRADGYGDGDLTDWACETYIRKKSSRCDMYEYAKVKKKRCLMMTGFRAETYLPIKKHFTQSIW